MAKQQLVHRTSVPGAPCVRCGIRYSTKNAYVPCFLEGDTFEQWLKRNGFIDVVDGNPVLSEDRTKQQVGSDGQA